jgi:hypothetical protein
MNDEIREGFDRVTEILSPFTGLDKIDPVVLEAARSRGTEVHNIIDCIINKLGRFGEESEIVKNMVDSFMKWAEGKKLQASDGRLYDEKLMITGEIDCYYYNEDYKTVIVDFKTPASESKSWMLQATAYHDLYKLNSKTPGFVAPYVEFVRLDRKGGHPAVHKYIPNPDLFLAALETYRFFFKNKKFLITDDYL